MGRFESVPYDRMMAVLFLAIGVATAGSAAYYYVVFLGLEDPLTHLIPSSVDYFSYVRYYYQTEANFQILWKTSLIAFGVSFLSLAFHSTRDLPAFRPFRGAHDFLRRRSKRLKTVTLAVPLILLEVGLLLYGGLMGLASHDLSLSLDLRGELLVRALAFGPLGPSGAAYGTEQDYYFLVLLLAVLAASLYRFGSVRRVLQIGALAIIPLPTLVYLFDRIEFNTFFASVVDRIGLGWFSNAVLLYLSVGIFASATVYPVIRRLASWLLRQTKMP
ncbi:MAG: hypothetical protein OK474_06690 [Thaumarchaeota archaeon]|nr:hypothetical protein [Nitrososphaerota archaeon]